MTGVLERNAKVDLPVRYHIRWQGPFEDNIHSRLEGHDVARRRLGATPDYRPAGAPRPHHVRRPRHLGEELRSAGPDAYDELIVADVTSRVPQLVGRVDLAVSWQVFEHIKPLGAALDNLHAYLKPGGTLVSLFWGLLAVWW